MTFLQDLPLDREEEVGSDLHRFATALYPICRSITGDGIRQTLKMIQERLPGLEIVSVNTGTPVLDWVVPNEWTIRDAYIKNPSGEKIVDFQQCNLHVLNYSAPVRRKMTLEELDPFLHSLPDRPDLVPYRTSYYQEKWGFCLSHNQRVALEQGEYEVCIDSTLAPGSLTFGEYFIPGRTADEILISCHSCHPSLANDNLSGVTVATRLAQFLTGRDLRYSYRFLFLPGTIGSITWLALNRLRTSRIRHGLVLTCIGDAAGFHYKKSRRGNAEIDRAVAHVLRHQDEPSEVLEFTPYGYDERQYCSPGFNLPVGCLMRSVWGSFPEYHTSGDNLAFIQPRQLFRSLRLCAGILDLLENNATFRNEYPFGEPQLGRRDLFRATGGAGVPADTTSCLWVLNQSDGEHSLLDIAERSGIPFESIRNAAEILLRNGLVTQTTPPVN